MAGRIHRVAGSDPGGIAALANLIAKHRGAFEHDWRARFHLPLHKVGGKAMRWGEAVRLAMVLARDPGTAVGAAVAEWDYPMRREALVLADLYDLQHTAKAKKRPRPYPRPWGDRQRTRRGTGRYSVTELRAVLAATRQPAQEVPPHG